MTPSTPWVRGQSTVPSDWFFDSYSEIFCQKEKKITIQPERGHASYFHPKIWNLTRFDLRVNSSLMETMETFHAWILFHVLPDIEFCTLTWSFPEICHVNANLEVMRVVRGSQGKQAVILQTRSFDDLCVWLQLWIITTKICELQWDG